MKNYNILLLGLFLSALTIGLNTPKTTYAADTEEQAENEYRPATLANFARVYWRLSKFSLDDDQAIDNFLRITECDVFRDYYHNEFEWRQIRETGRNFIKEKGDTFSLRMEFVQPLHLGEYDFETNAFEVIDEHKIENIKKFEIPAVDIYDLVCDKKGEIENYPPYMILDLSRPVHITSVPVPETKARAIVNKRIEEFKRLDRKSHTKDRLYDMRDTVLIMKVKFFSYQAPDITGPDGSYRTQILGVLEGIDIYAESDHENLLFSESYRRKSAKSEFEKNLREGYKAQKEGEVTSEEDP